VENEDDSIKKSRFDIAVSPENSKKETETNFVLYLCGHTNKLTSCNPLSICKDVEKTTRPVVALPMTNSNSQFH